MPRRGKKKVAKKAARKTKVQKARRRAPKRRQYKRVKGILGWERRKSHIATVSVSSRVSVKFKDRSKRRISELEKGIRRNFESKISRFLRDAKRKRRGEWVRLHIKTNVNKKGRRIESGISLPRTKFKTVDNAINDLVQAGKLLILRYERAKNAKTLSFVSITMEAVKKRASRAKTKGRRSLER